MKRGPREAQVLGFLGRHDDVYKILQLCNV